MSLRALSRESCVEIFSAAPEAMVRSRGGTTEVDRSAAKLALGLQNT